MPSGVRTVERGDAGLGPGDADAGAATGGAHASGWGSCGVGQVGGERLVGRAGPGLGPGDWAMRGDSVGALEGGERAGGMRDTTIERVGRRDGAGVGAARTAKRVEMGAVAGGRRCCGVRGGVEMAGGGWRRGWGNTRLGRTDWSAGADADGTRRGGAGDGGLRVTADELIGRQHAAKMVLGDGGVRGAGRSRKRQGSE